MRNRLENHQSMDLSGRETNKLENKRLNLVDGSNPIAFGILNCCFKFFVPKDIRSNVV